MDTIYLIGFPDFEVPHHVATSHLLRRQSRVYETETPRVPVPKREWQNAHRSAVSAIQDLMGEGLVTRDYYNNPSYSGGGHSGDSNSRGGSSGGKARCYHYWFTDKGQRRLCLLKVTRSEVHGHTFNALERAFSGSPDPGPGIAGRLLTHAQNCHIDPDQLAKAASDPGFDVSGDAFHAMSLLNNAPFCIRSETERRVHTSFSGSPSDLKGLVSLDGHSDLVEVDITGSNPFLLAHRLSALRVALTPGIGLLPVPSSSSSISSSIPDGSTHLQSSHYNNAIVQGLGESLSRVSEYYGYPQYSGISYSSIPYNLHYMCNVKTDFEKL